MTQPSGRGVGDTEGLFANSNPRIPEFHVQEYRRRLNNRRLRLLPDRHNRTLNRRPCFDGDQITFAHSCLFMFSYWLLMWRILRNGTHYFEDRTHAACHHQKIGVPR